MIKTAIMMILIKVTYDLFKGLGMPVFHFLTIFTILLLTTPFPLATAILGALAVFFYQTESI